MRRVLFRLSLFLLSTAGCAGAPRTASEPAPTRTSSTARATSGPNPAALRFPEMRQVAPDRPYIDLGPVFVQHGMEQSVSSEFLLLEADRLGADGFVVESEGLSRAYTPGHANVGPFDFAPEQIKPDRDGVTEHENSAGSAAAMAALGVIGGLIKGEPSMVTKNPKSSFLRAFRYVKSPPGKLPINLLDPALPESVRKYIAGGADLGEQLVRLTEAVVHGDIAIAAYERARGAMCRRG